MHLPNATASSARGEHSCRYSQKVILPLNLPYNITILPTFENPTLTKFNSKLSRRSIPAAFLLRYSLARLLDLNLIVLRASWRREGCWNSPSKLQFWQIAQSLLLEVQSCPLGFSQKGSCVDYCKLSSELTFEISYGVATISRLLKMIGLFCRISSFLQVSFAKENYNFKEPTNRSHFISARCKTNLWRKRNPAPSVGACMGVGQGVSAEYPTIIFWRVCVSVCVMVCVCVELVKECLQGILPSFSDGCVSVCAFVCVPMCVHVLSW